MANLDHLALFNQSIPEWNGWRTANPDIRPDLSWVNLSRANIGRPDLSGMNLNGANLNGTDLSGANLRKVSFRGANLNGANLNKANLSGADLDGADIIMANLGNANLRWANLSKANLSGADLSWTELSDANFWEANLSEANLSRAVIIMTEFSLADLGKANLSDASLVGANFNKANLSGTDFNASMIGEIIFTNVNLAEAKNLDTCQHTEPSTLDFRTLQKSGSLPLVFLRGCGLPDLLIDYLPSLLTQPIQFYSCFISYSNKDEDFAQRLHADLQDKGVRCWFAPEDIKGGKKLHEQIGEAIRLHEKLLLILSEDSMNSEWVKTEIAKARRREVSEKRQVLFPVRLVDFNTIEQWECFDSDTGKDSAKEIREYFIPDFSNWKSHDAYKKAFDRLLKDLKLELESKPVK